MFSIAGEGGTAAPTSRYTGQTVTGGGLSPTAAAGMQAKPSGITAQAQPSGGPTETIRGNTTFGRWAMQVAGVAGDSKVGGKQLEQLKAGFTEYMRWQRGGDLYKAAVAGSGKSYGGYSAGAAPAPAPKKPTYRRGYPAAM
jgi:hypothetical protein